VGRIYLFVPPEEYAEVEALDACWDDASKRWYIDGGGASAAYSRWNYLLHAEPGDVFFGLSRGGAGAGAVHVARGED
jgi:hypothetical protein